MTQQTPGATVVDFKRPGEPPADSSHTQDSEIAPWERPLVLLASPDATLRKWGERWLEREGLTTSMATSGAEALSRLQDQQPAVAIIDAGLRAGDGARLYEVLKQHEALASTPILVLCANSKETRRALEAEVTDVARRPVDWQILSRRAALLSRSFRAMAEIDSARAALDRASSLAAAARRDEQRRATIDPLTELPNRKQFEALLTRALAAPRRATRSIGVVILDLDRFGEVNATIGRENGDAILVQVGDRLKDSLSRSDLISRLQAGLVTAALGRLHSDRFALMVTNLSGAEDLSRLGALILASISEPFQLDGEAVYLTACLGAALYPADARTASALLQRAETALNDARRQGVGVVRLFSKSLTRATEKKTELYRLLRQSFERRELAIHYQPLLDVSSGEVVGAEALLRWHHPERGQVSPADFIPLAEETGLMVPIGSWVLETACRQLREWIDQGLPPLRMAVNVSICQLTRGDLVNVVGSALEKADLPPGLLELEISERGILCDAPDAVRQLREVRSLGVRLALDDFGVGDSAIEYLKRLPIDALKIDRSFVSGPAHTRYDVAIASAIVTLARQLDLTMIAEGVENKDQLARVRRWGCEEFQGFLVSPALGPAEFGRFLTRKGWLWKM